MNLMLSFVNPLEYLPRISVIVGVIVAILGCAILFIAKRVTMAVRKTDVVDKSDKLYVTLQMIGIFLVLAGMIIIALPFEKTLYKV